MEEVKIEQTKLESMLKMVDKVFEASGRVDNIPDRLAASIATLSQTQQLGEKLKGELAFSLKFQKVTATGSPLGQDNVDDMLSRALAVQVDLEADFRVCKLTCRKSPTT